ncbi:MAG: XrtN system VIT domain-containing protein, partial [Bacteroidota bacterium]
DEGERLRLRHVSFDGPATWKATATTEIQIHSDQELAYVQKPTIWHNEEDGHSYKYKGSYQSDWTLSFKETALSDAFFQFNGFQYQLAESRQNLQSWTAEEVILDINSSWDPITYRKILDKVGEKAVYVFLPEKTRITEDNADEVFLQLRKQAFALLPLYTLTKPEESLVITKSRGMSPLLVDVENTFYHNRMYEYFSSKPPAIKMICLGEEIPPYLKTLVDLGCVSMVFNRDFSWDKCLSESVYPQEELADEEVLIRGANVKIKKQPIEQESSSTATDHLARLHTYGSLMNSMGGDYFIKDKIEDTWIRKAEEGYIVSPVSSLVVLESEEDYDRFGIEENRNTLGNAAQQGDGSAPEPHEWALIILFGAILLFGAWKKWGWAIKLGV